MSTQVRHRGAGIGATVDAGDHPLGDWKRLQKTGTQEMRDRAAQARVQVEAKATAAVKQETVAAQKTPVDVAGRPAKTPDAVAASKTPAAKSTPVSTPKNHSTEAAAHIHAQEQFTVVKARAGDYQKLIQSRASTGDRRLAAPVQKQHAAAEARRLPHGALPEAHDPPDILIAHGMQGKLAGPALRQADGGRKSAPGETEEAPTRKGSEQDTASGPSAKPFNTVARVRRGKEGNAGLESSAHEHVAGHEATSPAEATPTVAVAAGIAAAIPATTKSSTPSAKGVDIGRGIGKVGRAAKSGLAKLEAGTRKHADAEEGIEPLVAETSEHSEREGGTQQALPVGGATRAPVIDTPEGGSDPAANVYNATEKDAHFLRVRQAHREYQAVEQSAAFAKYVALAERVQNYVVEALSKRVQGDPELVTLIVQASLGSPYGKNAVFG